MRHASHNSSNTYHSIRHTSVHILANNALTCCLFLNTSRPRQMAVILQTTLSNTFSWMQIYEFRFKFNWSFVSKGPINNIPALCKVMDWRQPGDKPLSEPKMVRLPTQICVTRSQWVKALSPIQNHLHFEDGIHKLNLMNWNALTHMRRLCYVFFFVLLEAPHISPVLYIP